MSKNLKIYIAGHNGLVGSAIVRKLKEEGFKKILTIDRSKLDLTNETKVYNFFKYGQWVKGITTCQVFEIACFENTKFAFIGNLEALIFVPLIFLIYFLIHLSLIRK